MPLRPKPLFSLVLPTYNAARLVDRTWAEILQFVTTRNLPVATDAEMARTGPWEVLFVCDGCSDGSDLELERRARALQGPLAGSIRVIRYTRNRGKGYAVRLGLQRAHGAYRIFTDVDLAYRLDMVDVLAEQLAGGLDVVIGSRAQPESEVVQGTNMQGYVRRRKLQSMLFSAIARTLVGIRQRDPQAGLKGLSARAVDTMLRYIRCYGFGFDCDLLVACRYFGIPVREIPIRVVYDDVESTTSFASSLRMIRELWGIRKRWQKIRREGLDENLLAPPPIPANAEAVPTAHAA